MREALGPLGTGKNAPVDQLDAVIIGAGPNGLTAAARLARAGRSVLVVEAASTVGGGCRTAELVETGFRHDVCAAFHPFGASSPAFAELDVEGRGVEWLRPDVQFAHPLDDGRAGAVWNSVETTAARLGPDARRWRRSVGRLASQWDALAPSILGPPFAWPAHPLAFGRFAATATTSATRLAGRFATPEPGALLAGCAAHAAAPLEQAFIGGLGLTLAAAAHARGWPVARGGSQTIVDALAAIVVECGGTIECGRTIRSLDEIPAARAVVFDTSPIQLRRIAGSRLPARYVRALERFRHGAGIVKVDATLSEPVPWSHPDVARAGTVHVGGTVLEIAAAERAVAEGSLAARPFVVVGQQSVVDPTRAPAGGHTLWAYCHVPQGVAHDRDAIAGVVERIDDQIERFAPGFRDVVRGRRVMGPAEYESYNPNCHGGDFAGGAIDARQLVARPRVARDPYRCPGDAGFYLCSSSTPPGPGAHGMNGWHAAGSALRHTLTD